MTLPSSDTINNNLGRTLGSTGMNSPLPLPNITGGQAGPSFADSGHVSNYINSVSGNGFFWPSVAAVILFIIWKKK